MNIYSRYKYLSSNFQIFLRSFSCLTKFPLKKIFLFGGEDDKNRRLGKGWFHDFSDNSWKKLPEMLSPRNLFASCFISGNIYAIGGFSRNKIIDNVEFLDISQHISKWRWLPIHSLPHEIYMHSAINLQDKIYVIGGKSNKKIHNSMWSYDPRENRWEINSSMKHEKYGHTSVASTNKIFVFGGINDKKVLNNAEYYDLSSDCWIEISPMPSPLFGACSIISDQYIYLFGGQYKNVSNIIYRYDIINDSWLKYGHMLLNRVFASSCLDNDQNTVFIFGGYDGQKKLSHNECATIASLNSHNPNLNDVNFESRPFIPLPAYNIKHPEHISKHHLFNKGQSLDGMCCCITNDSIGY